MAKVINRFPSVLSRVTQWPKTASVDASAGDWITLLSGYAKRGTTTTPNLLGVAKSTWTNDSNHTYVPVEEDEFGLWETDASTTPVQATHVGSAYDLTDQVTVNLGATTYKVLTVLGITPDGRALVRINMPFSAVGHI